MSVDAGSDDRQEPQFGKALYDFTAGGDEEVICLLSLTLLVLKSGCYLLPPLEFLYSWGMKTCSAFIS